MRKWLLPALVIVGVLTQVGTPVFAAETVVTIAVLPFENINKNPEFDWLGHGFAETLATKLCNISTIQLVERGQLSKVMQELKLQDTAVVDPKTAGRLGKVVGAKFVVVGSYQKMGDALKVNARRVEVETAVASGGVDLTGKFSDVFTLQSELALKVAEKLGKTPTEPESRIIAKAPTKSLTAYEWLSKGIQRYNKADLDGAIAAYTSALKLDPNYDLAYYDRGLAYYDKGDYDSAIADYDKAIKINPRGAVIYNNRGTAWDHKHDPDKAIANYNKALDLNPNYADAYINRGIAYRNKGDHTKALADYDRALGINPNDIKALNNRGNVYLEIGNLDGGLADFNKAIALTPDDAILHNNRGNAYYYKADYPRAIEDYDKAIGLDPKYAAAYYWKAWAQIKANRVEDALKTLRKYMEIAPADDPNMENARKMINAIEAL